jgi:hypothetical protein
MILGDILHLKSPFYQWDFICKNLDFSTTKLVPKREMSFDRKSFSQKATTPSGGLAFIAVVRSWRSVAGNAPATPGSARTDPTRATTTVTS